MTRPNTTAYGELVLPVFTRWEKVGSITRILDELEQGIFFDAALLVDQMMRDDRIRASFNTRFMAVLGKPSHMQCDKETAKAESIEQEALQLWPKMAPRSELLTHMKYGYCLGASVARREWIRASGEWMPSLRVWHPGALRFDLASSTYCLRTADKGEITIDPEDPNWDLFTPFGHKYGRIEGMLRPLAMLYLCRQWAFRDRARHSEVHGMPMRQIITPAEAEQSDKALIRMKSAVMGAESVIVTPQGAEGNLWDLKIVEAAHDSSDVFGDLISHVDDCVAIFVLGQAMSTKGQGGLGAQEKAGDSVRTDIMRFDAQTLGDLSERTLQPWAEYNHGVAAKGLRLCVEVEPPKDGLQKAQELSLLGDAIDKLEKYGADARKLLEETGIPMLTEAETAAKKAEAAQEAQDAMTPPVDPNKPDKQDLAANRLALLSKAALDARTAGVVLDQQAMRAAFPDFPFKQIIED